MEATSTAGDQSQYGFSLGDLFLAVLLSVVITALVAGCLWAAHYFGYVVPKIADAANGAELMQAVAEQENQYYRGAFDMCVQFAIRADGLVIDEAASKCHEYIDSTRKSVSEENGPVGWYNQPSPGWQP